MPKKDNQSFFGKIMGSDLPPAPEVEEFDEDEEDEFEEEELVEEEVATDEEDENSLENESYHTSPTYEDNGPENVPVEAAPSAVRVKQPQPEELASVELTIDMYQTKDNLIVKSTIAGVRPDEIDITVANNVLTVRGTRRQEQVVNSNDYYFQECYWGDFSRTVQLPVDVDTENIEADLRDGILTVILPKAVKAKMKKVKVKGL